jgi:hypothetical protein
LRDSTFGSMWHRQYWAECACPPLHVLAIYVVALLFSLPVGVV